MVDRTSVIRSPRPELAPVTRIALRGSADADEAMNRLAAISKNFMVSIEAIDFFIIGRVTYVLVDLFLDLSGLGFFLVMSNP